MAQLIKLWFKELPESIFAPQLKPIVDGVPQDGEQCAQVVREMPEVHRRVVDWLLELFTDVCRHEADNRMTATVSPPTTRLRLPSRDARRLIRDECAASMTAASPPSVTSITSVTSVTLRCLRRLTVQSMTIVFSPNLLDPPMTVDPMLALELNKRIVRFLERLFEYWNQNGGGLTPGAERI